VEMVSPGVKIDALVSRALHPKTPIEEARTSALVALRIMQQHGVLPSGKVESGAEVEKLTRELAEADRALLELERALTDMAAEARRCKEMADRERARVQTLQRSNDDLVTQLWKSRQELERARAARPRHASSPEEVVGKIEENIARGQATKAPPRKTPTGKWITSKYAGRCRSCGRAYLQGAPIRWTKSSGALCATCGKG
jgi:hypothetical protein